MADADPRPRCRLDVTVDALRDRVSEASRRHGALSGPHQAYGLLAEEVAELLDEIRSRSLDLDRFESEAMDVATIAVRAALWAQHRRLMLEAHSGE